MDRAFLTLDIKAASDDQRLIEGIATTPDADRVGDIVMPKGAVYKLPLPFLLDHDHKQAVGTVERVEVTGSGIKFWARIAKITEPGDAKDLCDKAWALVKHGLRRAVSIGFRPLESEMIPNGGTRFNRWEWLELSAVSVPANAGASISAAKGMSATISADPPDKGAHRVVRIAPARAPILTDEDRRQMAELKAWCEARGIYV